MARRTSKPTANGLNGNCNHTAGARRLGIGRWIEPVFFQPPGVAAVTGFVLFVQPINDRGNVRLAPVRAVRVRFRQRRRLDLHVALAVMPNRASIRFSSVPGPPADAAVDPVQLDLTGSVLMAGWRNE